MNTTESHTPEAFMKPAEAPKQRSGRKRLFIAGGAVLGVAALVTSAAFTDFGLLDFNGTDGFGGSDNRYNLQFSSGEESTADAVPDANWVEANPDAVSLVIPGAESLSPGGDAIYVKIPVKNDSMDFDSTLSLVLNNTTVATTPADTAQDARNSAYAAQMRFSAVLTTDASTPATLTFPTDVAMTSGATPAITFANLEEEAETVMVVRVTLQDGATQEATNAFNGGGATIQAEIDGSSITNS